MDKKKTTVVICCAGMGTRLGIGTTKALVNIMGKPLIVHQLELLKQFDDVRIVVGFQADQVIKVVNEYRKDVMFVFNYAYKETGVAASLCKGLVGAREYAIYMDGDLVVNPEDFSRFAAYKGECLAVSQVNSDEPVLVNIKNNKVIGFSDNGNYEWPGLAKFKTENIKFCKTYAYEILKPLLPLDIVNIRSRGIDTSEDYERAVNWIIGGCKY